MDSICHQCQVLSLVSETTDLLSPDSRDEGIATVDKITIVIGSWKVFEITGAWKAEA